MTRFERVFVWLGGAMFAASLAVCAYHYIVVWGRAAIAGDGALNAGRAGDPTISLLALTRLNM